MAKFTYLRAGDLVSLSRLNHSPTLFSIRLEKAKKQADFPGPYKIGTKELIFSNRLGSGSFATVYLGQWNGQQVAIKTLTPKDDIEYMKCENEKNIMQQLRELNAPYVVQFCGYSLNSAGYCIVMEYMNKGTLEDAILNHSQPFDWSVRYEILKKITYAITFLHKNMILHCDIKSANILLDDKNQVKLGDFGLAKRNNGKARCVGTPPWMAPELFQDEPHSEKTDIYALSMTMWEVTAWDAEPYKPAQFGHDLSWFMQEILKGTREVIPSNCPKKMALLITWGWQQNPVKRPTAEEYRAQFDSDITSIDDKLAALSL